MTSLTPTEAEQILTFVLDRYLPKDREVIITAGLIPQIASNLLDILGTMGWSLEYDPTILGNTVANLIDQLDTAPTGYPPRPPERLDMN